jgi:hypothetical protein
MTIFIGGNSHTGALKKGFDALGGSVPEIRFVPFGSGLKEVRPFSVILDGMVEMTDPDYAANLEKYAGKRHFDPSDIWGICMGFHNVRIFGAPMWMGAAPADVAGPTQRPISQAVLDEIIINDQLHVRAFIAQLKKANIRLFVISGPARQRGGNVVAKGVPQDVVTSIDRRARDLFEAWLSKIAVPFVDVPSEVVEADGFLKDKYAQKVLGNGAPDALHANAHYGRLMMEKVVAHIAQLDRAR